MKKKDIYELILEEKKRVTNLLKIKKLDLEIQEELQKEESLNLRKLKEFEKRALKRQKITEAKKEKLELAQQELNKKIEKQKAQKKFHEVFLNNYFKKESVFFEKVNTLECESKNIVKYLLENRAKQKYINEIIQKKLTLDEVYLELIEEEKNLLLNFNIVEDKRKKFELQLLLESKVKITKKKIREMEESLLLYYRFNYNLQEKEI